MQALARLHLQHFSVQLRRLLMKKQRHVRSACLCAETADDGTLEEMSTSKAIALRFGIMTAVVLVAALSFQVLGSVESIVGAVCSMSSSMLLPAFFFLRYPGRSWLRVSINRMQCVST